MKIDGLTARDLMSQDVVLAKPHESLRTAIGRMRERGIHSLLVAPDAPSQAHSILTGKDCIDVLCDAGDDALDELTVEDAMTRPAITIPSSLCVLDCVRLMRNAGVRTAPVVDGCELVGILTFTDVLFACERRADAD